MSQLTPTQSLQNIYNDPSDFKELPLNHVAICKYTSTYTIIYTRKEINQISIDLTIPYIEGSLLDTLYTCVTTILADTYKFAVATPLFLSITMLIPLTQCLIDLTLRTLLHLLTKEYPLHNFLLSKETKHRKYFTKLDIMIDLSRLDYFY
jgi:hypothetical protein